MEDYRRRKKYTNLLGEKRIQSTISKKRLIKGRSHSKLDHLEEKSMSISMEVLGKQIKHQLTDYEMFMFKYQSKAKFYIPPTFQLLKISRSNLINMTLGKINPLSLTKTKLISLTVSLLKKNNFISKNFSHSIHELVSELSSNYNIVSYHNFTHAFNLFQLLSFCFQADEKFKSLFCEEQIAISLIAALGHDINHYGRNNAYEVKIKSSLARMAENESVLQKMHILQKKSQFNLIRKASDSAKIKQTLVKLILATDMSRHFQNMNNFRLTKRNSEFTYEQKLFGLQQVFHACDIGNATLQYQEFMNWSCLLSQEFHEQTKLQERKGLAVSEQLKITTIQSFYLSQLGFTSKIVFPLWKQIVDIWPEFVPLLKNIQKNIEQLQNRIKF